jgi:predicted choloylglycine hydrolase
MYRKGVYQMKFVKKPVVIEAIQFTRESYWSVVKWVDAKSTVMVEWDYDPNIDEDTYIIIKTLEGNMKVRLTDWIICGVKGEFYPCKDDIFKMTYEGVKE